MLLKLSFRSAKRQWKEYALFFVTLACAAAAMYAFNALIFSELVETLPNMEILPWLIASASLLMFFIMSWLIRYMLRYMLKRRSREFSIYMVSGISNRKIGAMMCMENSLIGLLAFGLGILPGLLFSQILEAVLRHLFGLPYALRFHISLPAAGLTFLCFAAMMLHAIRKNRKWIRRIPLRALLCYDRQNEKAPVSGGRAAVLVFCLSVVSGCIGLLLLCIQPFGRGYDVLFGTAFLLLFLFGFFISVPAFLAARWGARADWKYKRGRLVPFRGFTAQVHSASTMMGVLSVLFMLALTFGGTAATIGLMVAKDIEESAFDVLILHPGEMQSFAPYAALLKEDFSARGHTYGLYTNGKTDLLALRDQAIAAAARTPRRLCAEFQHDVCISQSDYQALRALLHYEPLELDPALCYIHCVPALESSMRAWTEQQDAFAARGVFTEPFSQLNDYGNGPGCVIVVPDHAAEQMETVYSVYAAVTEEPLGPEALQGITDAFDDLVLLDRSSARNTPGGAPTAFLYDDKNCLSGKWADKAGVHYLYSIPICLFYLALVLEMTGAAILATQVLGDGQSKQRRDRILRQLGMREQRIARANSRQLSHIFLLPLLPALPLSTAYVAISAKHMLGGFFSLPPVPDILWIGQSLGIAWALFAALYAVYYVTARISGGWRAS